MCVWNPHGSQPHLAFQPQHPMPEFGSGFCLELSSDAARPRGLVNDVYSTWTPCPASCLACQGKESISCMALACKRAKISLGYSWQTLPRLSLMQDEWGTRSAGAQGERPGRDPEGKHRLVFRPTHVPIQLHSQPQPRATGQVSSPL